MKEIPEAEELHQLGSPSDPATHADAAMLLCPTCDEPFTPQFARCCGDCGHEFPDGFDQSQAESDQRSPEPANPRLRGWNYSPRRGCATLLLAAFLTP